MKLMPSKFIVGSFSLKAGSWSPNPAAVTQIINGKVQATFYPSAIAATPYFVTYDWTTAGVWYSQDGTPGTFETYGGNGIVAWTQDVPDTTFSAQFFAPGQYLLEVQCVANVYSVYNGSLIISFTQTAYIGGDASDIDTSGGGGGGTGHAQKAHGKVAHVGGGGAGITVVPATVVFSPDSLIRLGLGAPKNYYKIITATVTPASQVNNVSFGATNGEVSVGVEPFDVNAVSGVVTLVVTAVGATPGLPSNTGTPDCDITATDFYTEPIASVPVIVYTPASIGQPHTSYNGPITRENLALNPGSIPPYYGGQPGTDLLVTFFEHDMTITVDDQFGHVLDAIYEGAIVSEFSSSAQKYTSVHQNISANGTYIDPVGALAKRPGRYIVPANDPDVRAWTRPGAEPLTTDFLDGVGTLAHADVSVAVGGIPLNPSIQGRTVKITQSPDNIDIEWP